jgi:hypothetical protein
LFVGGGLLDGSGSNQDPNRNTNENVRAGNLFDYWNFGRVLQPSLGTGTNEEIEWPTPTVAMYELSGSSNDTEVVDEQTLVPTETPAPPEPTAIPDQNPTEPAQAQARPNLGTDADESWAQFREGYRDAGGNPEWEEILVCVVSKEAGSWIGHYNDNGYWTRAQFSHGDTWPKVQRFLISIGVTPNPDSPYIVGLGVAWWANQISHPSHNSGWKGTWALCVN